MIINADGMILGRLASFVARTAQLGENIDIVNCEKAIVTGSRKQVLVNYQQKMERGSPFHGPNFPKEANLIVRRTIRGMLPFRQEKGLLAFKRVKCHIGTPEGLVGKETVKVNEADKSRLQTKKYITLGELSRLLGA